jgi:hypothetical protein
VKILLAQVYIGLGEEAKKMNDKDDSWDYKYKMGPPWVRTVAKIKK